MQVINREQTDTRRTAYFRRIADDARIELTRTEAAIAVRERAIKQNPEGRDVVNIRRELVRLRFEQTEQRERMNKALFQIGRRI